MWYWYELVLLNLVVFIAAEQFKKYLNRRKK